MKIVLLTIALLLGSVANAYEVFYDDADNVTAIGNVEIDGIFYNVDFDTGTYGTFGGNDLFWSESPDAFSAAAAVNAILNSLGPDTLLTGPESSYTQLSYTVAWPDSSGGSGPVAISRFFNDEWFEDLAFSYGDPAGRTAWSVAAVPIPAAFWLFASALAGLGWTRRQRSV